ncbi:hypothetical protein Taro_012012 [Colocasia esculenta]|uniref:Uncharacterized protein n=1 Tax=Colocasia esculenta TaxID=4460 RepID=A0A843UCH5_COLES|nr:hypothetical protein [Colocasia esculenta]
MLGDRREVGAFPEEEEEGSGLEFILFSLWCFSSCVKEDLVGSRVLFPSVVKEDLVSVDTSSGQVDTSPRFQKTQLPEKGGQVDTSSGQVDTSSGQVDTRPSFQQSNLPNWESRSTLDQGRSVSISRSFKPSFQEEGQGNQGESLERRLLCKAREQIQLKRRRRRRISGISDAIKAEHHQLRRISIEFHQASSIEASASPLHRRTLFLRLFPSSQSLFFLISFCTLSHRALVCESSHSLCGLSRRAQFGVVVLRLLFESSCSVWSRRAPGILVVNFTDEGFMTKTIRKDLSKCGSQNQLDQQAEDVDTSSGQVDTSSRFQKTQLPEKGGQVDTSSGQVDTSSGQVDTSSGQVDTRPSFQQTSLPNWESRSTLDQGRSTHSG